MPGDSIPGQGRLARLGHGGSTDRRSGSQVEEEAQRSECQALAPEGDRVGVGGWYYPSCVYRRPGRRYSPYH